MKTKNKKWIPLVLGILAFALLIPVILGTTVKTGITKSGIIDETSRIISPYLAGFVGLISPLISRVTPHTAGWLMLILAVCIVVPGVVFNNILFSIPSGMLYLISGIILLFNNKSVNKYE